ncbi:MAG TPA: DoxX family protein [Roseiarcus sp.]|nr:DoxX family protein [Roseiarcus sp.]
MDLTILPKSWAPHVLGLFRIMTGLLFLEHGTAKVLGFPSMPMADASHAFAMFTGGMELIGGLLIVVGFLTRPVAFILSGYMAVAYFMAHAPQGFFPALNHGEMAIMFSFAFLYFAAAGAGAWAVDTAVSARTRHDEHFDAVSHA